MPQNPADGKVLIFVSLVMRVLLFPNLSEIAEGKKTYIADPNGVCIGIVFVVRPRKNWIVV